MNLITLFITTVFKENILLNKFLGMSAFINNDNKEKKPIILSFIITIIILLSSILTFYINKYILTDSNSVYLTTIIFVTVVILLVKLIEIIMRKYLKNIYESIESFFQLMVTNTVILGVMLLTVRSSYTLNETIIYALGGSIGYILVLYIVSSLKEKIERNPIINSFKGIPITLIIIGIIALIFGRYI